MTLRLLSGGKRSTRRWVASSPRMALWFIHHLRTDPPSLLPYLPPSAHTPWPTTHDSPHRPGHRQTLPLALDPLGPGAIHPPVRLLPAQAPRSHAPPLPARRPARSLHARVRRRARGGGYHQLARPYRRRLPAGLVDAGEYKSVQDAKWGAAVGAWQCRTERWPRRGRRDAATALGRAITGRAPPPPPGSHPAIQIIILHTVPTFRPPTTHGRIPTGQHPPPRLVHIRPQRRRPHVPRRMGIRPLREHKRNHLRQRLRTPHARKDHAAPARGPPSAHAPVSDLRHAPHSRPAPRPSHLPPRRAHGRFRRDAIPGVASGGLGVEF